MKTSLLITALVASLAPAGHAADVYQESHIRYLIADMTLGGSSDYYKQHAHDAVTVVALKEWAAGARAVNTNLFRAAGALVRLNTDPHFCDDSRRYLIAEMQLADTKEKIASFGHRWQPCELEAGAR